MVSTTNGVIWSAVERFSVQGVSFILSLIIARLISPGEYGLIAMLSIFMAIAQTFVDSGFGNALIQKKDRNEIDYSTVFYFNIAIAILCYFIIFLCAPLIARFYNQPELTLVTRYVGLNLILSSLSIVQNTKLTLTLNFKLLSKISLISVIISGVLGIILAYYGWGVWTLVFQGLLNNALRTILLWIFAKWKPLLAFSVKSFVGLFNFGSKLLVSSLMHTIYLNLYSLVIGKFYNASDVGYYNRAYTISQYPSTNIVTVLSRAIYPVQCERQNDDVWLASSFSSYLRMACYLVFPMMSLLAVIAKPLVLLVLTEKWLPCAMLISILCAAYIWYPVLVINNQMLNVKGRSDLFLKAEIIKKVVAVAILIATLPFGIEWLCIGIVIYNLFDMTLIIWFAKKVINTGYRMQFFQILPIFLISVASSFLAIIVIALFKNLFLQTICGCLTFLLSYIILSRVFGFQEFKQLSDIITQKTSSLKNHH